MPSSSGSGGGRARALAARGARLAGHVALAALCLELAARIDDRLTYGAPLWARYDADGIRSPDAEGIVRNLPGAHFEKWRINSLGFRGEAVPFEKPAGGRRVACVGTSESFGLYEQDGGEWPARLRRMVRAAHPGADAFNASAVGLRRDTRQRYIDRYVLPLRPDVVVLYFNVLSDATYRPPAAPGDAGPAAARGEPTSAALLERLPPSRVLPKLRRAFAGAFPKRVWSDLRAWRLARTVRRNERATLGDRPPLDALSPGVVAGFERHLREVVAAERARGVVPVLATYPTLGTVANRELQRLEFLSVREWQFELSDLGLIDAAARLNDAVRRVARELAVPLADVDAAMPKTSAYFADYVHYTDAGAELVAATVLAALERGALLGPLPAVSARGEGGGG